MTNLSLTNDQMQLVRDAIAYGDYPEHRKQVTALVASGFPKPSGYKKDDVYDYLFKISETTEISEPVTTVEPSPTVELTETQYKTALDAIASESNATLKNFCLSIGFEPQKIDAMRSKLETMIKDYETINNVNTDIEPVDPTSNITNADLTKIKSVLAMGLTSNDTDAINKQLLVVASSYGCTGNDPKNAKQYLKNILELNGQDPDPIANIATKKPRNKTGKRQDGDRVLIEPNATVKAVTFGTKTDYLVKAVSRASGASIDELEFIHHWSDNIRPALAQKLGISLDELDQVVPKLTQDPESITAIFAALESNYKITPSMGVDNIPKMAGTPWVNWDNSRVVTRLNYRGPGYGVKKVGGRYYIILPGDVTELPPAREKAEKTTNTNSDQVVANKPKKKKEQPQQPSNDNSDEIAALRQQNELLMARLLEIESRLTNDNKTA